MASAEAEAAVDSEVAVGAEEDAAGLEVSEVAAAVEEEGVVPVEVDAAADVVALEVKNTNRL